MGKKPQTPTQLSNLCRQAITTVYRGPTDYRGSKVIASCEAKRIHVPCAPGDCTTEHEQFEPDDTADRLQAEARNRFTGMRYRALWSIVRSGSGCHLTVQEGEHYIARERELRR